MANGMTTDVYHRDNCIAPDIFSRSKLWVGSRQVTEIRQEIEETETVGTPDATD